MKPRLEPRGGAALLISILVMLVLDCVVLGTLHLALLERRLADNAASLLRLRLAAEGGARLGAGIWTPGLDSMTVAEPERLLRELTTEDDLAVRVSIRRVANAAWAIRSEARQPRPGVGRSAATMLVRPPAIASHLEPAAAALSATRVSLMPGAVVRAEPAGQCGASAFAILVPDPAAVETPATAAVDGAVTLLSTGTDLLADLDRLFEGADSVHRGDLAIDGIHDGVLLVTGTLSIREGARIRGFAVAGGSVVVETGAIISGALHTRGTATIAGEVTLDACSALDAIDAAGLRHARPFPVRSWLPGFQTR